MAIVIEWTIFALLLTFIFTQIVYPLLARKPMFNLFRKSEKAKEESIDAYNASEDELELLALRQREKEIKEKITRLEREINGERKVRRRPTGAGD